MRKPRREKAGANGYDPRSALNVIRGAIKENERTRVRIPKGGEVLTAKGDAYKPVKRPETLCFWLKDFVAKATGMPADFADVLRTSAGLKDHTRPDGGVFHGLFEYPHDASSTVVVFGDPLMEMPEAIRMSLLFRERLQDKTPNKNGIL